MRYELSTRLLSSEDMNAVGKKIKSHFSTIAQTTQVEGESLVLTGIEKSFGSITRATTARIKIRPAEGGYLVLADVHYRPSFMFWVLIFIGLFVFGIFSILAIVFYFSQKGSVRRAVERALERIKNEFDHAPVSVANIGAMANVGVAAEIAALENLRKSGVLTDEEFAKKKRQLLDL
ncbi:SHOCT domain-containing protein [Caulobacter sp. S45]|jgi:hypothetical protein|uniref:SHOCT domain-containing protein n=1 Tax=Caulobacter sp. S45 TaxID=1641861 RepID=UPI00131D54B0|nr:SHOCT domain-containing protein [Caulobacter sp. S45]